MPTTTVPATTGCNYSSAAFAMDQIVLLADMLPGSHVTRFQGHSGDHSRPGQALMDAVEAVAGPLSSCDTLPVLHPTTVAGFFLDHLPPACFNQGGGTVNVGVMGFTPPPRQFFTGLAGN